MSDAYRVASIEGGMQLLRQHLTCAESLEALYQQFGTDPGQVITGNTYVPSMPYASGTFSNGHGETTTESRAWEALSQVGERAEQVAACWEGANGGSGLLFQADRLPLRPAT